MFLVIWKFMKLLVITRTLLVISDDFYHCVEINQGKYRSSIEINLNKTIIIPHHIIFNT